MRISFWLLIICSSITCKADEYFRFANIVCLERAGFFEISATGILNIDAYAKDTEIVKYIESKSNFVYGNGVVEKSCKLAGGLYSVKIEYTKASERGRCMGSPGASLSLKKDGKLIIDKVSFDWRCDWADINRLTVNSGEFIFLYGINYSSASNMKNSFVIDSFTFPKETVVNNDFVRDYAEKEFELLRK